jgi:hypothetical protein
LLLDYNKIIENWQCELCTTKISRLCNLFLHIINFFTKLRTTLEFRNTYLPILIPEPSDLGTFNNPGILNCLNNFITDTFNNFPNFNKNIKLEDCKKKLKTGTYSQSGPLLLLPNRYLPIFPSLAVLPCEG